MKITSAEGFRCPACGSVGLGEIKTFDDDGEKCVVFECECGNEEVVK